MHTLTILCMAEPYTKPALVEQFAATDLCVLVNQYNGWVEAFGREHEIGVRPFCWDGGAPPDSTGEMLAEHVSEVHECFYGFYNYVEVATS